jgi:hypothetical protein
MKNTNIRFYEKNPEDMRAWDILHKTDILGCKSQSRLVVEALNAYYDKRVQEANDPYLETREKEDLFVDRIVNAVEQKVFETLPAMVGMAFMQQIAGIKERQKDPFGGSSPSCAGADGNTGTGQQGHAGDVLSEVIQEEENELLDFDFCG